jgi:hypothetical protein
VRRSGHAQLYTKSDTHRVRVRSHVTRCLRRCSCCGEDLLQLLANLKLVIERNEPSSRTLAWPSAVRCAYMLSCSETLAILVACGSEDSAQDRLGKATSLSPWDFCCRVVMGGKAKEDNASSTKKRQRGIHKGVE